MKYSRLIFYFSLLVVFILSTVNANDIPRFNSLSMLSDKLVHLSIYAYLCFVGFICKFKISNLTVAIDIFASLNGIHLPSNQANGRNSCIFNLFN